jgi:hypothetical protein
MDSRVSGHFAANIAYDLENEVEIVYPSPCRCPTRLKFERNKNRRASRVSGARIDRTSTSSHGPLALQPSLRNCDEFELKVANKLH